MHGTRTLLCWLSSAGSIYDGFDSCSYLYFRYGRYGRCVFVLYFLIALYASWWNANESCILSRIWNEKKRSEETQTLSAGCGKAESKFFAPPQTPFPGAQDGKNLISLIWSLPLPTDPVWWGSMHAISTYRGNRPTNTPTNRQDRLQHLNESRIPTDKKSTTSHYCVLLSCFSGRGTY